MNTLAYFWAENARQSFTRAEILLYLYLNQNADAHGSICRSTAELAAALHLCAGTILRARKSLKERGIITLASAPGRRTTYAILPQRGQNRIAVGERSVTHGIDDLSNPSRFIGDTNPDDVLGQSPDGVDQPYSTPNRVENGGGTSNPCAALRLRTANISSPLRGETPDTSVHDDGQLHSPSSPKKMYWRDYLQDESWQTEVAEFYNVPPERIAYYVQYYCDEYSCSHINNCDELRNHFRRWVKYKIRSWLRYLEAKQKEAEEIKAREERLNRYRRGVRR